MEVDTANVTPREQCHPWPVVSVSGDIGRVAWHARSPFIISHRILMDNYIKDFFFFLNKKSFKDFYFYFFKVQHIIVVYKLNSFKFILIVVITFGITCRLFTFINMPKLSTSSILMQWITFYTVRSGR